MIETGITIKDVPAIEAVGVRKTIPIREVSGLFEAAARKLRSRPVGAPIALYYDQDWNPELADVEVVFPVESPGERTLPAAKVVSCLHHGPYEEFGRTYGAVFGWMKEKGHHASGPFREVYLVGPESGKGSDSYVTEIQVPIA